ncbi:helicase associated domain-containing protein [Kitasatospora cathayae]|uniref:Helicase associated domain-containing protein n=1 Tax=Kitasatospora cathayae TaxID=3004092 RepID=A0ABY7QEU8_9ACTN|nr:helicase associated domain-containing protein [Kitasatospora sp. HUAS 3-15]WBP91261.1 helicase associated domain-containing protein [Kitasatospora sp. HUAS 3-15]
MKAEADAEIEASSFRTIWRVLRALAAHDARVVGRITELRASRSQGTAHTTTTTAAPEGESTETGEGEQQPAAVESPIEWLRINAKHHAAQILQTVKLRAFNPRAVERQRMHAVAARFHIEHGHLDPTDKTKHAELISWLTRQRHLNGQGLLDAARVSELDALGMIWSKNANAWERGYAYAKAFHHQHGHLAIPATAKLDDYAVGAWMRRQRKADTLTKDQVAKLDALDELWRLEPDWNRSYRRLLAYLAAGGTLDGPANRTGGEADPTFRPGTWLRKQAGARTEGKLTDHQTALLDALTRHTETVAG